MRNIIAVFKNDFKLAKRDFMIAYIMVAPFLLAGILALLIPSAEKTALPTFAVMDTVAVEVVEELDKYGEVLEYEDIEVLKTRVLEDDDVIGLTMNGDEFQIIAEGNEDSNILPAILQAYETDIELPIDIKFSDVGYEVSTLELMGIPAVLLLTIYFTGLLIGFTIIEDKSSEAIDALSVSTITKSQYMIGKCVLPFIVAFVDLAIIIAAFGLSDINFAHLIVFALASSSVGIVIGYIIGVVSNDQMGAVTIVKLTSFVVMMSAVAGVLLPGNWKMLAYWSPAYWAFEGMLKITSLESTWTIVAQYSAIIVGITVALFLVGKKRLKNTTRLI